MPHVPSHPLPDLYARWLDDLLNDEIPPEPRSTCDDCAMCPKPGEVSVYPFQPDVKCCVYQPALPNFLVGGILGDDGPDGAHGRAVLEERLAGPTATPLGVERPPSYDILYRHTVNTQGRSRTLRCPFFDDGRCGIHRHRNHLCATWFCRPARGQVGQRFWDAVSGLLRATEGALARWCCLKLEVDPVALAPLLEPVDRLQPVARVDAAAIDGIAVPARNAAVWGDWHGREADFYLACSELVAALSWAEVLEIGGPEVQLRAAAVCRLSDEMHRPSPPRGLRVAATQTLAVGTEASVIAGYSPLDPIALPALLLSVLPYFDGRPPAESFAAIEEERGIRLDDALIRQLLDFGILVDDR